MYMTRYPASSGRIATLAGTVPLRQHYVLQDIILSQGHRRMVLVGFKVYSFDSVAFHKINMRTTD